MGGRRRSWRTFAAAAALAAAVAARRRPAPRRTTSTTTVSSTRTTTARRRRTPGRQDTDGDRIGDACELSIDPTTPTTTASSTTTTTARRCRTRPRPTPTTTGSATSATPTTRQRLRRCPTGDRQLHRHLQPQPARPRRGRRRQPVRLAGFTEVDAVQGMMYENNACYRQVLVRNDDSSSQVAPQAFLPQQLDFFGLPYSPRVRQQQRQHHLRPPLSTFTPFELDADTPPIIAPFFADVDTRPDHGGQVSLRRAVSTRRFRRPQRVLRPVGARRLLREPRRQAQHVPAAAGRAQRHRPRRLRHLLQLRQVQWETGDASDGENGLGGDSAGAGFSSGSGDPNGFFQLPCSLVNGACLDSNQSTGLRNTSTNSLLRGRHIFEIRGGGQRSRVACTAGSRRRPRGRGERARPGVPGRRGGALERCRTRRRTIATGRLAGRQPRGGRLPRARHPAGQPSSRSRCSPRTSVPTEQRTVDISVEDAIPPRAGRPSGPHCRATRSPTATPGSPIILRTEGCNDATASYVITHEGSVVAAGGMVNAPG